MASAGFRNRIFVRQTECYLVAISSFLSSQPAFAIADVGSWLLFFKKLSYWIKIRFKIPVGI